MSLQIRDLKTIGNLSDYKSFRVYVVLYLFL